MYPLDEWNTMYCCEDGTLEFMFPVLDKLVIHGCPRLRLKPNPPTFCEWNIYASDKVLNSGDEWDSFSHFKSSAPRKQLVVLCDRYCGSWRLLHHLPILQELAIKFHDDEWMPVVFPEKDRMTSLPESLRQLPSLSTLELYRCNSISILPDWLGDLKSLECLRILYCKNILYCKKIKSMPSSIQQLTKLRKLHIAGNHELKQWCESEENKMKLAHIKDIVSVLSNVSIRDIGFSFLLVYDPYLF
jgi:Leucine-rich repeat (LRR) protein